MALEVATLLQFFKMESLGFWKLLTVFFALLNLKQVPFAWHVSTLPDYGAPFLTAQSTDQGPADPHHNWPRPSALFRPLILASRAAPLECDYNLHKSNSTYFADFDLGRMHLLMCLCRPGIVRTGLDLWEADGKKGSKRLWIKMGGVSMNFRREIKPLQKFEMWNRVLSWDRKWIYVVTYFVEKDKVRPKGWLLQPWRDRDNGQTQHVSEATEKSMINDEGQEREKRTGPHPAIFATGIAKYVAKRGRLTISPERILQNSGLLPSKPKDQETPPVTATPVMPVEGDTLPTGIGLQDITSINAESLIDGALDDRKTTETTRDNQGWDWERVEKERQKGMKIAEAWNMTEKLSEDFDGHEGMALGRYYDFP
ncbi:MAG: hypothetical protein Q9186_000127 [Xanthomendoza sp. 1 TL-2023]